MKVSAKTRYAARILLALAHVQEKVAGTSCSSSTESLSTLKTSPSKTWSPPSPVSSHLLAEKTGVTVQFTEQILKALKRGGLTTSTRGAAGGHSLTRAPELISLGEVVRIMEGGIQLANCVTPKGTCSDKENACERAEHCAMRSAWSHVTQALEDTLAGISLADLVNAKKEL